MDGDGVLVASGGGVVAAPGRVVTSLSLAEHARAVVVQATRQWEAEVDGWRSVWNLARLDVAGCDLPPLGFRASRTLRPGETLYRAGVRDGFLLDVTDASWPLDPLLRREALRALVLLSSSDDGAAGAP